MTDVASVVPEAPETNLAGAPEMQPGEILIQFQSGMDATVIDAVVLSINGQVEELIRGGVSHPEGALLRVKIGLGMSIDGAIATVSPLAGVSFAEPNFIYTISASSNDPSYSSGQLWGMYGDATSPSNQFGSQAGEAWAAGHTGSSKVAIGVVDTGIDYTHPDLYLNIWLNQAEIPLKLRQSLVDADGDGVISFRDLNVSQNSQFVSDLNGNGRIDAGDLLNDSRWENGLDDDTNGYVDDLIGWDFVNGDNDPYDDNGHGTHVSGTIGALGGNGVGVAGVSWATQIVALKFLSSSSTGTTSNAIKAIDYFTNASVVSTKVDFAATNNSWTGGSYSQSLFDAIVRGAKTDILFIAAAGNGGSDQIGDNNDSIALYPANYNTTAQAGYDAVISVASLTSSGLLSGFSNFGATTVDLGAPGSGIYSTLPGGGYGFKSGTSMAAPHVAGAVALYSAISGQSASEIKTALLASVALTDSLQNKTATGGRLDVLSFVLKAAAEPTPSETIRILSAFDNEGAETGDVVSGGTTDDTSPLIKGSLSAPLRTGEVVAVYRDGVRLGTTNPSELQWSFQDNGLSSATYGYEARVEDAAGAARLTSPSFTLNVSPPPPPPPPPPPHTITIASAFDDAGAERGDVASGATTDDTSPLIKGSLSAPLNAGEVVALYRDGARIGSTTPSSLSWQFQDSGLSGATYTYEARVEDAAGTARLISNNFTLIVSPAPEEAIIISSVIDDAGAGAAEVASGGTIDDNSPLVKGSLSSVLRSGEKIVVYRDGLRVGDAISSGRDWSYQDAGVPNGSHIYQARIVDAAGATRILSTAFSINVVPTDLYGTAGSDTIAGTTGAEKIMGIPADGNTLGLGTVDILVGGGGHDVFVLGDARGRFYDDGKGKTAGTSDYALIKGFDGDDQIQLFGNRFDYFLSRTSLNGVTGLGIYHDSNASGQFDVRDELIALLEGVQSISAGQLTFVSPGGASPQSLSIVSAFDNVGRQTGEVSTGETINDPSPLLKGVLSIPLNPGEVIIVFRNGTPIGHAEVLGVDWSFQDADLINGHYSYQAHVFDAAGDPLLSSLEFSVTIAPEAIYGTKSSESIFGSEGSDMIWGIPAGGKDLGRGNIDTLTGGAGSDIFVLGDARGRFYDDGKSNSGGTSDFALITDFGKDDKIQLAGAPGTYLFSPASVNGSTGLGIYHDSNRNGRLDSLDELICLVSGVDTIGSAQLIFV